MDRRTMTMNWNGLGDIEDDDQFFESNDRISSAVSINLADSGSDDEDFDDSRMSFASTLSSTPMEDFRKSSLPSSFKPGHDFDLWTSEPGSVQERRKRLLQGMGLSSQKELLRIASVELKKAVSTHQVSQLIVTSPSASNEPKQGPPRPPLTPIMLARSRSHGDIASFSDRQVVDWIDLHEMVTAACYTPDGQGAIVGTHKGICRLYSLDDCKLNQIGEIDIHRKKKAQAKKITGFQFVPEHPNEVLITSADSRIRLYDGSDIIQKFRGFRNISSQIAASFSPDGKYIICASEDSQVYVWKHKEVRNAGNGKSKAFTNYSHEHFQCRDVSVAISWPGCIRGDPPSIPVHSKRHSKRSTPQPPFSNHGSPTRDDNCLPGCSKRQLPPLPKKHGTSEKITSCPDEELDQVSRTDSGISIGDSFSSASIRYDDSPSISAAGNSSSSSWSSSWSFFDAGNSHGINTIQPTAWGLVIVTAGTGGEIKAYQNYGLPVKIGRQTNFLASEFRKPLPQLKGTESVTSIVPLMSSQTSGTPNQIGPR